MKKYGDARDNKDYKGSRSTMLPRHREGQAIAGGRELRRRSKALTTLQKNFVKEMPNTKRTACRMPGSMSL
jgi:hypothetical protein